MLDHGQRIEQERDIVRSEFFSTPAQHSLAYALKDRAKPIFVVSAALERGKGIRAPR
jgi:hypothetical protein